MFDIELGPCEYEFDEMLAAADGWPSHLQNTLKPFAQLYVEAGGDIEQVDFMEVEHESQLARQGYYRSRMSSDMATTDCLLAAVMRRLTGRQSSRDVIDLIESEAQNRMNAPSIGEHLPDGKTAIDFFDELIHHGALQERDDGTVHCPIPSFRQFLIEYPTLLETPACLREAFGYDQVPDVEYQDYLGQSENPRIH